MSYGIYVGKNLTSTGLAWLAGYGDEPSSHWLEINPSKQHAKGKKITVGVNEDADMPGKQIEISQASETIRNIRVAYSYYKGVPAPITNGGLNEFGVAVRDIWSTSRNELVAMTPKDQNGPNYSDFARIVVERAKTAREGVELIAKLIAKYGESSYGGNSHLIADTDEAWVMIQFAGGQGLWAAERLGPEDIRASRPGYIGIIPVDEPDHPDFLYSCNLVSFAKSQDWYSQGEFDVNQIFGDGKGRWEGVQWIETEMRLRAKRAEKIGLEDMIWAIRSPKLTGDTAGYGQVVPLTNPAHNELRHLWHAPIGPIASPFAPVFMGQNLIPEEFQMHRYLTTGEAHRFIDDRTAVSGDHDALSKVSQRTEAFRCAVYECKRLLYLMLQDKDRYTYEVVSCFEIREAILAEQTTIFINAATALIDADDRASALSLLGYFSSSELLAGLELVSKLTASIEARVRITKQVGSVTDVNKYDQVW